MLPLFTTPIALIGLASLPALVAIYYLRNRPRRQVVSSILLWIDPRETPQSGTRFDRLRAPLLFWIELVALLLLVLAAIGPRWSTPSSNRPIVVVLDDSFSMLAGGADSPRKRAQEALIEELRKRPRGSVRLILAGERAQVLGEGSRRSAEIERLLDGWTCQAPTARLDSAIALGLDLGSDVATILVLSDHAPNLAPEKGRILWWSFGKSLPNFAFVNANRTAGPRGDRLLFEIANLGSDARSTTLRVETGEPPRELRRAELRLNGFETHRLVLELPGGETAPQQVRASLDGDDLLFDNSATLLPASRKIVRYDLRLSDKKLRSSIEKALKATGTAIPAEGRSQIIFHDGEADSMDADEAWGVRILNETDAEAFIGPFVLDRSHPLMEGLSLNGVVWGGGKSSLPGAPIVMAGNVPLLTSTEFPSGRHEIRIRLRPDLSTLTESPSWPALIWNLVQWRADNLSGIDRPNIRLGQEATWALDKKFESIELIRPGGESSAVPVRGRRVVVRADKPGVYMMKAGAERVEFSANALNRDESDLTKCASGRWGEEQDARSLGVEYRESTWLLVLVALAIMALHLFLVTKAS